MSALIGANNDGRAGLICYMPEGRGEQPYPAKASDVIAQGVVCCLDIANATPAEKVYKVAKLDGTDKGPFVVTTKAKLAGELTITGVGSGFEVTVWADGDIYGDAFVKPSTATAGQVMQGTDPILEANIYQARLNFAQYKRLYKYANSGDGNHPAAKAVDGDLIVIRIL